MMGHAPCVDVTLNIKLPAWNVIVVLWSTMRHTMLHQKPLGGMPKQKPAERIINILRSLSKEHSEQSLGSHIILATEETDLELLSDKALLEYLIAYESSVNNPVFSDGDVYFPEGDEDMDEEDPYYAE